MIIVLKQGTTKDQISTFSNELNQTYGVTVNAWYGEHSTVLGLLGDTAKIDIEYIRAQAIVESVKRVQEPYKKANRKFHPDNTVIQVGPNAIGDGSLTLIAGPCSVESSEQLEVISERVKKAGAGILRGGAFKPRTSPYAFQGLRAEGLYLLLEAKRKSGLPIITEIMSPSHLPLFEDVDIIQVGARNMQNFELLKELGHCKKPILLKRGLANTIEETLMSAEYIMASGNENVILCERGIRTFDTFTRGTLDLAAVPALHEMTHLPVLVDPSHAAGRAALVTPLALAAAACGADGVMVEMHPDPLHARCDGAQALLPEELAALSQRLHAVREACR